MNSPLLCSLVSLVALVAFSGAGLAEGDVPVPVTLMAKPGKLLVAEDFSKPLPAPVGSTAQFASGFQGWRCNVVPPLPDEPINTAAKRGSNARVTNAALPYRDKPSMPICFASTDLSVSK